MITASNKKISTLLFRQKLVNIPESLLQMSYIILNFMYKKYRMIQNELKKNFHDLFQTWKENDKMYNSFFVVWGRYHGQARVNLVFYSNLHIFVVYYCFQNFFF